jgi:hypothetical protein
VTGLTGDMGDTIPCSFSCRLLLLLGLWTLWARRGLVHKSTACARGFLQAVAATIDEAEDDRAVADRPAVGGLDEADRLAGQRAVDVDKFAAPFDFAGQAHAPHLAVGRIVGLAQHAVPAPRRGLVTIGWRRVAEPLVRALFVVQLLTRRHTVRKLATRSRSSTLGIPGWDALFAFMK